MNPVSFQEQNLVLAKDQPEYLPLPVHVDTTQPSVPMTSCWLLSDEDIERIIANRRIYITQLTCGQAYQPLLPRTENPFANPVKDN